MFKIYEKPKKAKDFYLTLKQSGCGVDLVVVDRDGEIMTGGYLLTITVNGRLKLERSIRKDIGLDLDETGRIKLI